MKYLISGIVIEAVIIIISLLTKNTWLFSRANETIFGLTILIGATASGLGAQISPMYTEKQGETIERLKQMRRYALFAAPIFVALIVNYLFFE